MATALALATALLPAVASADIAVSAIEPPSAHLTDLAIRQPPRATPSHVSASRGGPIAMAGLAFTAAFAVSILVFGWRDGWFGRDSRR